MSHFNFRWTCPEIDQNINQAKIDIESWLDAILDEACPLFDGSSRSTYLNEKVKEIYNELEPIFEETRKSNSEMRDEAENQIQDLKNQIETLEAEKEELENKVTDLEADLTTLQETAA